MNFIYRATDIQRMIQHWLGTPPNGYRGVTYARNLHELLFKPMNEQIADLLLQWMKEDIPMLNQLNDNELSIVSEDIAYDKKQFYIQVGQILIPIQDNLREKGV